MTNLYQLKRDLSNFMPFEFLIVVNMDYDNLEECIDIGPKSNIDFYFINNFDFIFKLII